MNNIYLYLLNENYPIFFDNLELMRDGGSASYAVYSGADKYFLRKIKPAFFDTAVKGAEVQAYLQNVGFPTPPIVRTNDGSLFVQTENGFYILYEFIDGEDSDPGQDAEIIGALVGNLHRIMKNYPGELIKRDKRFYIGRYVDILKDRNYPRADEFHAYGNSLWERIKGLPQGFCHGDMYNGNIRKTPDGKFYILDFDTSCDGFPMYDPTLICDMTEYFKFDKCNYEKSCNVLTRFLPAYINYNMLNQKEIDAFPYLIAMQHFATQATIMEIFGNNCLSDEELDGQLDWLYRWREQCESEAFSIDIRNL